MEITEASSDLCNTICSRFMICAFSFLQTLLKSGRALLVAVFCCLSFLETTAQSEDYRMQARDEEFTMEVLRDGHQVKIILQFRDASQYKHAMIEKTDEIGHEFRQCAYVALMEEKTPNGVIEKRDRYPRITTDSFYRLRTVTKEGIERTYPPVRLPEEKQ
jgi:hypothetical protein